MKSRAAMSQGNRANSISINLRVGYIALYVAILLLAVALLSYAYSRANQENRQTIAFGASLLGASIAILALLYNAQNVRIGIQDKKREAASKLIERWNHPSYVPIRSTWREFAIPA
jgi:hypothetical protein